MIDKNLFFREVTIRICSSLQITTALGRAFEYLRQHIPLDILSLIVRDDKLAALRRIAQVAADKAELIDEIIPLPEDLWAKVQSWEIRVPAIMGADEDEVIRGLAPHIMLEENSIILIPLWVEKEFLGGLTLRAWGKGIYNSFHVNLLSAATEPFAIALANALAHENLLKYRDIL